jgi:glycosyltransferase involved in cell wall biosynthesis
VKRIGIVVVAYNAAATLAKVLDRIPDEFASRISGVLVCDNHSEDPTYLVGLGYQQATERPLPLTVIRQERNLGYGGNQKTGYRWAIDQGFDIAVLLHADGQYAPEMLPDIVAPLERGEADAVFGSRMMQRGDALRGGMPLYKYIGNKVLSTFENRVVGTDLSEWHSGYRAYSVPALRAVDFERNSDEYDFDTGIILQLHHAGKRIVEIPIPTFYGDEISYVNGLRYAKDIVADVIRYRAHQLGLGVVDDTPAGVGPAAQLAEGLGHRMAAWLSGRPAGRALVVAEPEPARVLTDDLAAAGHDVTTVDLDGCDDTGDALRAVAEAGGDPAEGGGFDVVAAVGLLERSVRPERSLETLRRALRPGGVAVLAVANVAHWYPRARAATGRFTYERHGALAESNVRFFTRGSLARLLRAGGLEPRRWEARGITTVDPGRSRGKWSARVDALGLVVAPKLFTSTWLVEVAPSAAEPGWQPGVAAQP